MRLIDVDALEKEMCSGWYRSDSEWGDVVYDDTDILAWMPLPEPYEEEE